MRVIWVAMESEWHEDGIAYATGERDSDIPALEIKEMVTEHGYWVEVK